MLTKIHIQGFRGLSDFVTELEPCTVFIGPNNCGKSTVLQAALFAGLALEMAVARQAPNIDWNPETGDLDLFNHGTLRDDADLLPTFRWQELFFGTHTDQEIAIKLTFSEADYVQALSVFLSVGRADALRLSVSIRCPQAVAALGDRKRKAAVEAVLGRLRDQIPQLLLVPSFSGGLLEEEYRSRRVVEDLLRRGAQNQIVRNLLVRLRDRESANGLLRDLGLAARLERVQSRPDPEQVRRLRVRFQEDNGLLELSAAGTGLISLLALHGADELLRSRVGPRLLLLDEPEAHLHPRLQGDLAERLSTQAHDGGIQLLVATHSVEMIERFGRLPQTSVLRIDRKQSQPRVLTTSRDRLSDLQSFCDLSMFSSLHLLAHRKMLFHEGRDDEKLLRAVADAYFGKDDAKRQAFAEWAFASLEGVENAEAKDILRRGLLPLFELDELRRGAPLRVVRVLDSDGKRPKAFDLTPPSPETGYEELKVTWSRYSIESLFLDAPCLAAWLYAALKDRAERLAAHSSDPSKHGPAPTPAMVDAWVQAALLAADQSPALREEVTANLMIARSPDRSESGLRKGLQEAGELLTRDPATFQRGKSRAYAVLNHIRRTLEADPATQALAPAVPCDLTVLLSQSPLRRQLASSRHELFPDEIRALLDHLARPTPQKAAGPAKA